MISKHLVLVIAVICSQAGSYDTAKVSETDCTVTSGNDPCTALGDAECENAKCKCSDGFKEVVSGADSTCEQEKVTNVDCTKDEEDQCAYTENAECDNAETSAKCKCSDDYIENPTDGFTCVQVKVSNVDCMKEAVGQCAHTANAECDNAKTNAKCRCSADYIENPNDGFTCVKLKVSSVGCIKDTEGQCTHTTNAECDNAESDAKCKCSNSYRENPDDDSTCVKTLGSDCSGTGACPGIPDSVCDGSKCTCRDETEKKNNDCILTVSGTPCSDAGGGCENIDNSICNVEDGKCTCSPGFKMKVDECVGNSASTFKTGGWLAFVLFCILNLIN